MGDAGNREDEKPRAGAANLCGRYEEYERGRQLTSRELPLSWLAEFVQGAPGLERSFRT